MASVITEQAEGRVIVLEITGKLAKEDYERFAPAVERHIKQHGKVRMLVTLRDFHGWEMGALWEDIKFDVKHFNDIEKLALVGESKWEKGMAKFCAPFTTAEIKYFDHTQLQAAREWIEAGSPTAAV